MVEDAPELVVPLVAVIGELGVEKVAVVVFDGGLLVLVMVIMIGTVAVDVMVVWNEELLYGVEDSPVDNGTVPDMLGVYERLFAGKVGVYGVYFGNE